MLEGGKYTKLEAKCQEFESFVSVGRGSDQDKLKCGSVIENFLPCVMPWVQYQFLHIDKWDLDKYLITDLCEHWRESVH